MSFARSLYNKQQRVTRYQQSASRSLPVLNHHVERDLHASTSTSDDVNSEFEDADSSHYSSQANTLLNESSFIILLPYICDSTFYPHKQPILTRIKTSRFRQYGFAIPFVDYYNETKNHFKLEIKGKILYGRIIAFADSRENLKDSLNKNICRDPDLSGLRKMVKVAEGIDMNLSHAPLRKKGELPKQTTLSENEILNLFATDSNHNESIDESECQSETQDNYSPVLQRDEIVKDNQSSFAVPRFKNQKIALLKEKIYKLESKKDQLSEYDATSRIIRSLIDISKELFELLDSDSIDYEEEMNHIVPQPDQTYKKTALNRIYLEGVLPLDLKQYENGIKNSRIKNPASIAYQLVKFAFPEHYYLNVNFGRIAISSEEFRLKKNQTKKPFVYVIGFKDPLDNPFQGEFSIELGQQRIRALIDHIFRKAGKLKYTKADEMKVRARIIKEFSAKNRRKKCLEQTPEDSQSDESKEDSDIFSDRNLSQDVWDDDLFP